MTFKEYEAHAASTACYAKEVAIPYVVMGLTNELAEVFEKVDNAAEAKEIMKEVGDVLWYVAMTRQELQLPPVEFPEELHKLDDTDVYRLSPSYLLQQVGIINGQVKKYFRDDDYSKPFPEKRKEFCHTALEQILIGLQNLVTYIEGKEPNQSLVSIAKQNVEKLAKRKAENKIHGDGDNR